MQLIADFFLAAGAFGAALYCFVLQRRLNNFARLENGMGSAVAVLSAQVDDLTRALHQAQATAASSAERLTALTNEARQASVRLDFLVSSLHDLPDPEIQDTTSPVKRLRFTRSRQRSDTEAAE